MAAGGYAAVGHAATVEVEPEPKKQVLILVHAITVKNKLDWD